ncbi:MAG: ABC transporter substrate-binding protein [Deltaproteobacteria bacterium]|nr:ABC transporter substrate-binding protein [Deltaproteobacteria bacterium]
MMGRWFGASVASIKKRLLIFSALFGLAFLSGVSRAAQIDEHERKLVEGAKKEGRMVYYTAMSIEDARALAQGFESKYAFIKTDIFRSGHERILSRLNVEHKTGRHAADAVIVGEFEIHHLKKLGLIAPYHSPRAAGFTEGLKDPDGYWTDVYDNLVVTAYNVNKVKPEEIPRRYEDLLHPRWKGRMALDHNEDRWVSNLLSIMGKEKGVEFLRALSKQNIYIRRGRSLITQLLLAGEFDLQITAYWYRVHRLMRSGAPLRWVGIEPALLALHPISLAVNAPHPNAARLFIDYVVSEEGQIVFARRGREAARPGIKPEGFPGQLKVLPSRPQLAENLEENNRLFEALFLKGVSP